MNRILALLMIMATTATAGVYERALYYGHTNGVELTERDFVLRDDGQGVYIWVWNAALPQPAISDLPNNAASMSFVATAEQFQVVGVATDTNTIKAIRQDLRIIKGNVATNKAQMKATVALTNGFSQAELRSLVNDLRRELIDTISEQQAQDKALLDMLKAQ